MKIEAGKKYRTRDGKTAHVLAVDAPGRKPVIGYIVDSSGQASAWDWQPDGRLLSVREDNLDLIAECREKKAVFLNIYDDEGEQTLTAYLTKEDADLCADKDRIACVRIEYEEGEGL